MCPGVTPFPGVFLAKHYFLMYTKLNNSGYTYFELGAGGFGGFRGRKYRF
jgi:hypothetical protein